MQLKFLVKLKSVNGKTEVKLGFLHAVYSGPFLRAFVEPGKILPPHAAVKHQVQEKRYHNILTKC